MGAGCNCLPAWNYTSLQGNRFQITSGCANPDNDSVLPWCPIDPSTCTHSPAAFTGRLTWDYCYNLDDKVTIDTGAAPASTYLRSPKAMPSSFYPAGVVLREVHPTSYCSSDYVVEHLAA